MKFPFDPIGLDVAVANRLPRHESMNIRDPIDSTPWSQAVRGWRYLCRRIAGERRWQRWRRRAQLRQSIDGMQSWLEMDSKPICVYAVPYDVVNMQTGGGRRIGGIAKALATKYRVVILSLSPSARPFSMREICPGVWMVAIPASREFEEEVRRTREDFGLAAPLLAFSGHFNGLPEYEALLDVVQDRVSMWVLASPFAWPSLRSRVAPDSGVVYDVHDNLPDFFREGLRCNDPAALARAEALEAELAARATVAAFCTDEDRKTVGLRIPEAVSRGVVIPNGVDVAGCRWVPPAQVRGHRARAGLLQPVALFVGSNFKPNREAVDSIVRELAPSFPSVIFVVMGMRLAPYLAFGGLEPGKNLVFTGPISEELKSEIYSLSDIALAPMKSGTGSSLKIPDYVAHGKVVIGTPMGLRGFEDLRAFESVVATEDVAGALATVVEQLARDPEAYTQPCRLAREWVAAHLDWSVAARPLMDALEGNRVSR